MLETLDSYKPLREWYLHDVGGIHGWGHAARVLVWADHIAAALAQGGTAVDREAVRWAAALHDVRRQTDGADLAHGERCAEWLTYRTEPLPLGITAAQLQTVIYCVRWHVPDDADVPQMTSELRCLKDADSLDRVRIDDLDPDYLRTAIAKTLPAAAQKLYDLSQRATHHTDQWNAVKEAATEMALWR